MKTSNLFSETLFNYSNNILKYVFMSQKTVNNDGKVKIKKFDETTGRKIEIIFRFFLIFS